MGLFALGLLEAEVALEEEVELFAVEATLPLLNLDGHLEREHELVSLEEAEAGEVVDVVSERLDDVAQAALEVGVLLGRRQGEVEHLEVHEKRILVHGVDHREAGHDEEEDRPALGDGHVLDARGVNLLGGDLRLLEVLRNLHSLLLRVLQRLDERRVVQNLTSRLRQLAQQRVLQLLQQRFTVAHLLHQAFALLLEVRSLVAHGDVQQLLLKTLLGDGVVDDHRLT